jgi:acyl-CoA synthetase (AMP-forming)/AMP-acid ligase II
VNNAVPLLQDFLLDSARRLPKKVALVCRGQRHTYAELDGLSNALAHALIERGVQRGDRVILFLDNTLEAVVGFWAVLKAGGIVSIVNPLTKADKLAYLLNDCRAVTLITDAHIASVFVEACKQTQHLRSVIVSGKFDAQELAGLPGAVSWDGALAG